MGKLAAEPQIGQRANWEFVCLMAMLMSVNALAIDAMLPAMGEIASDLKMGDGNAGHLIVSVLFAGSGIGVLLFGPLSDAVGRKPAINLGLAVFLVGSVVSVFAETSQVMLLGRFLQGLGTSSCRVVCFAIVRDRCAGVQMARVMSLIMMIFILVPAIAPSFGQVILMFSNWRAIFGLLLVVGLLGLVWLNVRLPESLLVEKRIPLSWPNLRAGVVETALNPTARGYGIASGLAFGGFIGFLGTAQPMFQESYGLGNAFSLYFGGLALSVGLASFVSSKVVVRFGMVKIAETSLLALTLVSAVFVPVLYLWEGTPPLFLATLYMLGVLFCFGILFSNLNTLAISPLGHIAGTATTVVAATQTFISTVLGSLIAYLYDDTMWSLGIGFASLSALALVLVKYTAKSTDKYQSDQSPSPQST